MRTTDASHPSPLLSGRLRSHSYVGDLHNGSVLLTSQVSALFYTHGIAIMEELNMKKNVSTSTTNDL